MSGYVLAGLYDLSILRKKKILSRITALGFPLTAVPYVYLFAAEKPGQGTVLGITLIVLVLLCSAGLIYSVFIEPFFHAPRDGRAYTKGTYSCSRHPGFIWYTGINLVAVFYFMKTDIALLCASLVICNLVLITVEDAVLFPRMFDDYDRYREQTPFILALRMRK
jgi:protein-S-isoprenylcysteine O-methyltransferase Ste14